MSGLSVEGGSEIVRIMLIYAQLLFAWSFPIMSYCVGLNDVAINADAAQCLFLWVYL